MKRFLLAGLLLMLVFPAGAATQGNEVVTAEKLTIEDVKGLLSGQDWVTLVEVHGIYQDGNKATVHYKGKEPVPPFISKEGFQMTEQTLDLVRFNSGKWFVPRDGVFLKKPSTAK
jgi:hypothetical protein